MDRTIGLIFGNYAVSGFSPLTEERPPVSIPFGGRYRLLDFALSNMINARVRTVGLITPYYYRSIMDHIGAGKEWGLDRKGGGLFILPGTAFGLRAPDSRFLFRDVLHNLTYLQQGDGDYVLVSSGTLVCNIDYLPMIAQHELEGRPLTFLCRRTAPGERIPGYYLSLDDNGEVTGLRRGEEGEELVLNSFIIDRSLLLRLARDYAALGTEDLMDILSLCLGELRAGVYRFDGYVGFMNGTEDYMRSSMDLLETPIREQLFDPARQIRTKVHDVPPALYAKGSEVRRSLITSGSIIHGQVENSVLFRRVRVEKGARVKNCVLMEGCVVGKGAVLENVICDKHVTVRPGMVLRCTEERPCVVAKGGVI